MPFVLDRRHDIVPSYDEQPSFDGGMVSNMRSSLLGANQFAEAKNMDRSRFGTIQTRRGTATLGIPYASRIQGAQWFAPAGGSAKLLVFTNKTGYTYANSGTSWTTTGTGYQATSTTIEVDSVQLVSTVYLLDGTQRMYKWDGSTYTNLQPATYPNALAAGYKYLTAHQSRVWAWGLSSVTDQIAISDALDPSVFSNSIRIGGNDGDDVVAANTWINNICVVFKRNSTWTVDTTDATIANWSIQPVHSAIGCIARRSVAQVSDDIWFLSKDGIRSLRRIQTQDQNVVSKPISYPIQDWIERINESAAYKSCATFHNGLYLIAVPLDSASDPNYVFIYNTKTDSWSGYWTGWTATIFVKTFFSNSVRLCFGRTDGAVWKYRDYTSEEDETSSDFQDNGTDYESYVISRGFNAGDKRCPKLPYDADLEFNRSTAFVTCSYIPDDGDATSVWSADTSGEGINLPVTLPFTLISLPVFNKSTDLMQFEICRSFQIKIAALMGKIALRGINPSMFVLPQITESQA